MHHKYKAWDKKNNVMREAKEISFYLQEVTVMMAQEKCINSPDDNHLSLTECEHTDDIFDFEYIDLLQFTGFYAGDSDAKDEKLEIYDGAILAILHDESSYNYYCNCVVFFDESRGQWMIRWISDKSEEELFEHNGYAKIIGSIQENPELLNVS